MAERPCPLCQQMRKAKKFKLLYNAPICRKCYYRFANRRQLAYLLDALVLQAFAMLIGFGLAAWFASSGVSPDDADLILAMVGWVALPLVFFLKDGFAGHSLGKLAAGVQVVDRETFEPIGFGRSFLRNLPLIIPIVPLFIAFMLQKGYRWGDGWARSKVIWKRYRSHPVFTGGLACEHCQYDLTGNTTGVCPECGTRVPSYHPTFVPPLAPPTLPGPIPVR